MLLFRRLKNHAGLCLSGSQTTLRGLYETVHEVNDASPLIADREGFFAALAYDVRVAREGRDEVFEPQSPMDDRVFGFKVLWPVLLLQTRMLRASLAFFDSTKDQQASTYALEAAVEAGLTSDFGQDAPALLAAYKHIDPSHPWAESKIHSRGAQWSMWDDKQRQAGLLNILQSLDPMYPAIYELRFRAGERGLLSPLALDSLESADWVDPNW